MITQQEAATAVERAMNENKAGAPLVREALAEAVAIFKAGKGLVDYQGAGAFVESSRLEVCVVELPHGLHIGVRHWPEAETTTA